MGAAIRWLGTIFLYRDGDVGGYRMFGDSLQQVQFGCRVHRFLPFPTVLYLAPFYAGITDGNWFPAILVYGGTAIFIALASISSLIERK